MGARGANTVPAAHVPQPLLRIQLDYQLLLRRDRDVRARRTVEHPAAERLAIYREPGEGRTARGLVHRRLDGDHLARLHPHTDLLTGLHLIARDVHRALVDLDMSMPDQLPSGLAARGEAKPIHHVVETTLQRGEQIVARDTRKCRDAVEGVRELRLTHAVNALDLLLFAELLRVLRRLAPAGRVLSVLAGRVRTTLDGALLGEALGALEKKLRSFTPTLLAARPNVAAHDSDSPTLWRTAAVMRDRRDVLD